MCRYSLCVPGCVTSSSDFLGRLITRDQAGKDTARLKYFRVLPEPSGGSFGHYVSRFTSSAHNSYYDCFPEGKAENEIENSKENSTLVPEMGNSECFTP